MSYGPIWYEWSKRPMVAEDVPRSYMPFTHTRHGTSLAMVTELYWCQPGLYRGAPAWTRTKYRELRATIVAPLFCTNDEYTDRVFVTCTDFVCSDALAKAIEYANSKETAPGSTSPVLLDNWVEYVPGQEYPCQWCGRTAAKVCLGYYDPLCVDAAGRQHSIQTALDEFDTRCQATRKDAVVHKDGTHESHTHKCYYKRGHKEPHGPATLNEELWPTQVLGEWVVPADAELSATRQQILDERTASVERCKQGLITAQGLWLTSNTVDTGVEPATIVANEETNDGPS